MGIRLRHCSWIIALVAVFVLTDGSLSVLFAQEPEESFRETSSSTAGAADILDSNTVSAFPPALGSVEDPPALLYGLDLDVVQDRIRERLRDLFPLPVPAPSAGGSFSDLSDVDAEAFFKRLREDLERARSVIESNNLPPVILERLEAFETRQIQAIKELYANRTTTTTEADILDAFREEPHEQAETIHNPHPFRTKQLDPDAVEEASLSVREFERRYGTQEDVSFLERVKNFSITRDTGSTQGGVGQTSPVIKESRPPQAPGSEFTAETEEIQFTQAIIDKAAELGNDPRAILNFVRNEIDFVPYYGVKKGADATLLERQGNAFDQATLLSALLRVGDGQGNGQIPTRYKEAVIKLDPATVMDWLGVSDSYVAAQVLSLTDTPYTAYVDPVTDEILFFTIDHVYVEAYIDYGYSRGLIQTSDDTTKEWIPLEPSLTRTFVSQSLNIFEEMQEAGAFDTTAFYEDYLNGVYGTQKPIDALRSEVDAYLNLNHPKTPYEGTFVQKGKIREDFEFIPRTLAYEVVEERGEYSAAPDTLKHSLNFLVESTDGTQTFLDYDVNVAAIADQELVLTYQAATQADQDVIDSFGSIYDVVPLSLVHMKPVLNVAGITIAGGGAGDTEDQAGAEHDVQLTFTIPTRNQITDTSGFEDIDVVEQDIEVGNTFGIALNLGKIVTPESRPLEDTDSSEFVQAQKLYRTAQNYLDRNEDSQQELSMLLGGEFDHNATRAFVFNGIDTTFQGGEPYSFAWKGLRIDASSFVGFYNRVADEASELQPDFGMLFGLEASLDESNIFEEDYNIESMSTVKGLRLINTGGVPGVSVVKIDQSNESVIDTLNLSQERKDEFHQLVQDGNTLYTPDSDFTYLEWTGLVYIYLDPTTGSAGYIIGEGLNGGYTVEVWTYEWQQWWRVADLFIGGTATIIKPTEGQVFTFGDLISWEADYDGLTTQWTDKTSIDSEKELEIGTVILYSGYGTDASVTIEIDKPVSPIPNETCDSGPTRDNPKWTKDFYDDCDIIILGRLIFGEARGASTLAKEAVGWTVRNRVELPSWPDSYHDVILEPFQFAAFSPGDPNLPRLQDPLANPGEQDAWFESYDIAEGIINDQIPDPVIATFYFDDSYFIDHDEPPSWTKGAVERDKIETLNFYYRETR